jgi:hypothetical protein
MIQFSFHLDDNRPDMLCTPPSVANIISRQSSIHASLSACHLDTILKEHRRALSSDFYFTLGNQVLLLVVIYHCKFEILPMRASSYKTIWKKGRWGGVSDSPFMQPNLSRKLENLIFMLN